MLKMHIESAEEMYFCIVGVKNVVSRHNKFQTILLLAFTNSQSSGKRTQDVLKIAVRQWKIHSLTLVSPNRTGINQASLNLVFDHQHFLYKHLRC